MRLAVDAICGSPPLRVGPERAAARGTGAPPGGRARAGRAAARHRRAGPAATGSLSTSSSSSSSGMTGRTFPVSLWSTGSVISSCRAAAGSAAPPTAARLALLRVGLDAASARR